MITYPLCCLVALSEEINVRLLNFSRHVDISLEVEDPDTAGIDIGNESHYVAVPANRDSQPVRCFGCTTAELKTMAIWLKQCAIRTVALQSTGVYWVAVYDILEQEGLEVYLVNARDTKNLPGRNSDVQESSMPDEIAHVWTVAKFLPATAGDPHDADPLAAA